MSPELQVRKSLHHGALCFVLDAVLQHGVEFVEQQLEVIRHAHLSERAYADRIRKIRNIRLGIEKDYQDGQAAQVSK